MQKLKLHSPDITQANIDKLAAIADLFPNCITEVRHCAWCSVMLVLPVTA
ncbi:hypothetical protein [Polaromonas sp.]|nr:hypothetical protein [Burkholderiales bacterium]